MEQSSLAYLVWLVHILSPTNERTNKLITYFGSAEQIFFADEKALLSSGILSRGEVKLLLSSRSLKKVEDTFSFCEKNAVKLLTLWDEDYPEKLKSIEYPPVLLFYKGNPIWKEAVLNIAVAGTRRMTAYAEKAVERIVGDLADVGCLIVGGMSEGVDACAHDTALTRGGRTAAVLPGGVDVVYPQCNYDLYWRISENGCVLSEFFPGTRPVGANFQPRNRLIAAMSDGVLHVQSPEKSGSLITIKWATEFNRDVFALPGDIDVRQSEGPNRLIQDGAKLVTGAMDILAEYGYTFAEAAKNKCDATKQARQEDSSQLSGDGERKVAETLRKGDSEMTSLAEITGLELSELILLLTDMQIKGIICEKPGGMYSLSKTFTL